MPEIGGINAILEAGLHIPEDISIMGYDGIQDKEMCLKGFQLATNIIDRCESMIS